MPSPPPPSTENDLEKEQNDPQEDLEDVPSAIGETKIEIVNEPQKKPEQKQKGGRKTKRRRKKTSEEV